MKKLEPEAFAYCQQQIAKLGLPMKLIRVSYTFDGGKVIFYFSSENRVDFRELVKILASHFHTRIELRQVGSPHCWGLFHLRARALLRVILEQFSSGFHPNGQKTKSGPEPGQNIRCVRSIDVLPIL